METSAPSIRKVITMVLFALSCAGLLLFLWLSFGGTIPFNPQGYRIQVPFPNAVQLSDIFNALDQKTRTAFQVWQQSLAQAVQGNDQNLNNVLGNLPTFAADATDILQVLDIQHLAVVHLVQNGGTVFAALSQD